MQLAEQLKSIRVQNLRELHGRPAQFGAPTSQHLVEYLVDRGVNVSNSNLTRIYQGTEPITDRLANQIESAFSLPEGWLSSDHGFVYTLGTPALQAHTRLASLPKAIQEKLYALIEVLANDKPA